MLLLFHNSFELIFSFLIVVLIYRIINTINVVESVLLLILLAINFSLFLFFYNISFLAILYLAVYIGAVAVFFLFVVMMTDLNNFIFTENDSTIVFSKYKKLYLLIISIFGLLISNLFITLYCLNNKGLYLTQNYNNFDFFNLNIELIGFSMFNEHSGPFVIISIIILVTLIGSIFITSMVNSSNTIENLEISTVAIPPNVFNSSIFNFTNTKSQDMENQYVRNLLNAINLGSN